jgi:uncharacterized protein (TIGR03435 family)
MPTIMAMVIALVAATLRQSPSNVKQAHAFEVASVKVNRSHDGTTRRIEPDRMTYLNVTLGEFIEMAYGVKHYQISGPDWVVSFGSSDRYCRAALKARISALSGQPVHLKGLLRGADCI